VLIMALAGFLLVYGFCTLQSTPLDVFPEFASLRVEVQVEAPGLSTEEVESLITLPIEQALNGLPWMETIRSKTVLGLSSVVLIFQEDTDLIRVRSLVQERLALVSPTLPAVVRPPVILSPLSSTSRALKIGISSQTLSRMELTDLALWKIRPRLRAIPGVANVAIWGQRDRQYQVLVDPRRLQANGISLNAVMQATRDASLVAGGGFIETPNQQLPIRQISPITTPNDLAQTLVSFKNNVPIRLGDVTRVVEGHPPPIGDAIINGAPGLLLIVEKQPWGNTLDVTQKVEAVLDSMRPGLAEVEIDSTIFRPATFIEMSLKNLQQAMLLGSVLVIMVLVAFLFEWRTAVISLVTIPLSLMAAAVVLHFRGGTINTMVLAGLVIALGEIVDDAIIDVENIMRRLRLNQKSPNPSPAFQIVLQASLEVRSAVVFASLIVCLVFLPVFFLPGLSGAFFRPLALSYVLAIMASLLVALTVTPALSLTLLPQAPMRRQEAPLARILKTGYRSLLPHLVNRPRWSVAMLIGTLSMTLMALPLLGEEFLPNFMERDFLMHWVGKPGTSLEAMQRSTLRVSQELRAIPGVRNFGSHIGRAEVADEVVGPNFAELWISLDPNIEYAATVRKIQEVVDGYPGLYRDVLTYLRERIKEVLTGTSAAIVVRIYGPDLQILREKAQQVHASLKDIDGLIDLKVESQVLVPHVQIRLRPDVAANLGLSPGQVRSAVATLLQGFKAGEVYQDQEIYTVAVWGEAHLRTDVQALRHLPLETPGGTLVPLGDIADIAIMPTPNEIKREAASRRIDVTANVAGRDLGSVAREIESRVKQISFDRGYHPEILGEYAARQESQNR
ncbi:MAG: efflux RND transporter permease subunit, partial [Nitrospirales bacterium]|nr:efflux RND transporter permease subunit [Nitrospirales bacterium]